MKRLAIYIMSVLLAAGMFSCDNDNGNYDYKELNAIAINGIPADTVYIVDQNDTLRIGGISFSFALNESDNLEYEWVVNKKLISTGRECKGIVAEVPGDYSGYLCVTDLSNNLKYYQEFDVRVATTYSNGLYVLTEKADGTASLAIQRRDRENAELRDGLFELSNPDFGELGRKPVQVVYYEDVFSGTRYVYVFCQEGERKITSLSVEDLSLQRSWNESSIAGGDYEGSFAPESFMLEMGDGMVVSDGDLFLFNYSGCGALSSPITGYDFSWAGVSSGVSTSSYAAYDEGSDTFYELSNMLTGNSMKFEVTNELNETLNTQGMTFRACGTVDIDPVTQDICPVLYNPETGEEHYFRINVVDYMYLEIAEEAVRPATMNEEGTALLSNASYWFAAKDNVLIRYFFSSSSQPENWTPALEGDITAILFDDEQARIFVAAYDGTNSYIHEFSTASANTELAEPLEVEGKVVSMCVVGNWTY